MKLVIIVAASLVLGFALLYLCCLTVILVADYRSGVKKGAARRTRNERAVVNFVRVLQGRDESE